MYCLDGNCAEIIQVRKRKMSNPSLLFMSARKLTLAVALLSLFPILAVPVRAQDLASPPIADPADKRFSSVTEDWTTPALSSSHLLPVPPLSFVDDTHPGYTVELLQLQWRWGDPLD